MFNKALLPVIVFLAVLNIQTVFADDAQPAADAPAKPAYSAEFYIDFLAYRYDLHRRVIMRWEDLVKSNRDKLRPQRILLKYYINSAGAVSVIESESYYTNDPAKMNGRKLAEYALAMENKSPAPFPDVVKEQFPNGFFYQISLSVR